MGTLFRAHPVLFTEAQDRISRLASQVPRLTVCI